MTNKEISKVKGRMYEIQKDPSGNYKVQWGQLTKLATEINAPIPAGLHDIYTMDSINKIVANIHQVLQTEMMLNACVSARWSCIFAASASILSLIATATAFAGFLLR